MAEQKRNLAELVRTVYFYFFTGFGLILLIVGIFQLSQWGVKSYFLPKYDLSYEETRCDFMPEPAKLDGETSGASVEDQKSKCLETLETQRKTRQVTDLAQALTFIVVGGAVFIFHFRKTSLLHK
jgi:hypothetical protein